MSRLRRRWIVGVLGVALVSVLPVSLSFAADHEDSPQVRADPPSDFGDVFAWMSSDALRLNLLATVIRRATQQSRFSDATLYVFHTQSSATFGAPQADEVNVECVFDGVDVQIVTCTVAGITVTGNANDPAGITSSDGRVRVFAGLLNDAFFFNANGFNAVRRAAISATPSLTFDAAGCPLLDGATSSALLTQLQRNDDGGPAPDTFGGANILVLAVVVDRSLVTPGGPIVAVFGSTEPR